MMKQVIGGAFLVFVVLVITWHLVDGEAQGQQRDPATGGAAGGPVGCPGDVTGSGFVDVFDLLALLGCWGDVAPGCEAADVTETGQVDVFDLLALLGAWGPCPDPGPQSCEGQCGGQAGGPGSCWCDEACFAQGDCCDDVCPNCPTLPGCSSCVGNCGLTAWSGCWCDSACIQQGDCCWDACAACDFCNATCEGHCGSVTWEGCWCDSSCWSAGDCCPDVCVVCEICP